MKRLGIVMHGSAILAAIALGIAIACYILQGLLCWVPASAFDSMSMDNSRDEGRRMGKIPMGAVIGFVVGAGVGFYVFSGAFALFFKPGWDPELHVASPLGHVAGLLGGMIGMAFEAVVGARPGELRMV